MSSLSTLVPPAKVDLYWTSQNYHDLHNMAGIDVAAFNKEVFDSLKPGVFTSYSTMRRLRVRAPAIPAPCIESTRRR